MSFPWIEYLTLAEALVQARGTFAHDEACCRAAISRAYYAAYGATRNHARDGEGLALHQTSGDHRRVILHYQRTADRAHQEIAELLFRLRRLRTRADYDDQMPHAIPIAHTALRRARRVFDVLQALQA